jgi:PTS system nitrogen regulatory IIA component
MLIAALLVNPDNIQCQNSATSKKRAIENISHLLAANTGLVSADAIFQALFERERLGSTGLGKGVAIPHARIPGLTHAIAVMMTLDTPIDYDAADKQKVDIIFGLIEPEDDDVHHLEHLARIVTLLRDPKICQSIRQTTNADKMFDLLLAVDDD